MSREGGEAGGGGLQRCSSSASPPSSCLSRLISDPTLNTNMKEEADGGIESDKVSFKALSGSYRQELRSTQPVSRSSAASAGTSSNGSSKGIRVGRQGGSLLFPGQLTNSVHEASISTLPHHVSASSMPSLKKISETFTTSSGSHFFGLKGHRSVSQESFEVPVNTCFSAKGNKGRVLAERKTSKIFPASAESLIAQEAKGRSFAVVINNENANRPRKRRSYPLLAGYETEMPGVRRLPLSPVKAKQPRLDTSFPQKKPNVLGTLHESQRRVVLEETKSPGEVDVYDPENSLVAPSSSDSFTIHRRLMNRMRKDVPRDFFSILPDEMILKILILLPKTTLFNCLTVNNRFHDLSSDEVLWKRIDASGRFLTPECVGVIFSRNPVYLRLARTLITCPIGIGDNFVASQLTYLDLSMTEITTSTLAKIMSMCKNLVKLSLEALCVTSDVIEGMMSFSASIDTLNLTMCYDVNLPAFVKFMSKSIKLKSLNLGCIKQSWTREDLMALIRVLPMGMESVNLAGFVYRMRDEHVELLVQRLPNLKELDLSDSQEITIKSVQYIVNGLKGLEALSLSRCYNIRIEAYSLLPTATSVRSVQLFAIFKEPTMTDLQSSLPLITFNQQPCSTIARPTVGNRRSTIWGQRVRDLF